jgi:hypothetical protein
VANGNTTVSRLGQVDGAGDAKAIFLKQFAHEVLTAFKNTTATMDKHLIRTIQSGKSAQFPITGIAQATYHTPGTNIADAGNGLLNTIKHAERVINIDELLIAATFIANLDEAMNHYDVRSIYSTELGTALALKMDGNVLRKFIGAARTSSAAYTGGPVGTVINAGATLATTSSVLAANIAKAARYLDEKNVPATDRFCFLRPEQYSLLTQDTTVLDKQIGGSGSYADGVVQRIAGVALVKTNQIPSTNESATTGDNNTYHANYTDTVGVVAHRAAVGTVKLLDLGFESEYKIELQGTLMVAKYAMGHGVLRPECAVELSKAA